MRNEILLAEANVIGAVLIGGKSVMRGLSLKPEHFSVAIWRDAWDIMLGGIFADGDFNPVEIAASLTAKGHEGASKALLEAMKTTPTVAHASANAEFVRRGWKARKAWEIFKEHWSNGIQPLGVEDALAGVVVELSDLMNDRDHVKFEPLKTYMYNTLHRLESPTPEKIIQLGLRNCDWMLGGLRPADYVIMAARPAVGKSAFAAQAAVTMARAGQRVAFYSLEMTGEQIAERVMARESGVSLSTIRSLGAIAGVDMESLCISYEAMGDLPIQLSPASDITPSRVFRDVADKEIDVLIIDHLGLMRADRKAENRNNEVAQISRDLRLIAMRTKIPIIALCQLNRGPESRSEKRPLLSDLRDSGSLEQDATAVIALSPHGDEEDSFVLLEILKNRQGETGKQLLRFDKPHMKFTEVDCQYEEPTKRRNAL